MPTKLEALYRAEMLQDECRALAHKVYKLLTFVPTESTDLFREMSYYIMMIIKVVMASEGLTNNAESRTIQASCSIAYAAGNIYPVFSLMTGGKMLPTLLPSVVEEVFDFPLRVCMIIIWVQLLQELVAPEKVTLETATPNAIPSTMVSAPDPTCHLSRHALGIQIKRHHIQNSL